MKSIGKPGKARKTNARFLARLRRHGAGTLVEYTVIISIVSIAAVVMLKAIGTRTNALLEMTNSNMPQ